MGNDKNGSGSKEKTYAVANGRQTGLFESYKDQVHPSTNRYPSNIHQKFSSEEAAERALSRGRPSNDDTGPYYAVKSGRNPGIYPDWIAAAPQVLGHPNNEHRKFEDRSEAERYMGGGRTQMPTPNTSSDLNHQPPELSRGDGLKGGYGAKHDSTPQYGSLERSYGGNYDNGEYGGDHDDYDDYDGDYSGYDGGHTDEDGYADDDGPADDDYGHDDDDYGHDDDDYGYGGGYDSD
ncbi:hypothetical protein TWF718_005868 [Orbilia javanica]|uniref:Ribonuclease H1 N-terminal domain-containing protein n=1 Tax=Orbilia javanica TaxID=47235 RepID=A0AAN8MQI6_9PEZI